MIDNDRVLFSGPAGTGKTVLAVEAARRAAKSGESVLLLCFNRLLGQYLQQDLAGIADIRAMTLHRYMLDVAQLQPNELDRTNNEFWAQQLPNAALEGLVEGRDSEAPWDVLIVDEAQDILTPPYMDVLDLTVKGGLSAGSYMMFADFEKQNIFSSGGRSTWPELLECVSAKYNLRTNCRNTPRIAAYARLLGGLDPDYTNVLRRDDGIKPKFQFYSTAADQPRVLAAILSDLRAQRFASHQIVLLSPKAEDACAHRLDPPWSDRLAPVGQGGRGKIGTSSIHAFKGLESPVVVLTDLERIDSKSAEDLFYVGITRALHRLIIVAAEQVRTQMERKLLS